MRRSFIVTASVLGLALGQAAHAQPSNTVTTFPPALNAQQGAPPSSPNSVPPGAATGSTIQPGSALGGSATPAATPAADAPAVNSLHPLRQPRRAASHRRPRHRASRPAPVASPS